MFYLQMYVPEHTIKIIVLLSLLRHKLKLLSKCCVFKVCQYIEYQVCIFGYQVYQAQLQERMLNHSTSKRSLSLAC